MSDDISYGGKPLSLYSLWELGQFLKNIEAAETKREEASKHKKFHDPDKKLFLPEPNPKYLEMKNAIVEEIRKKQNV